MPHWLPAVWMPIPFARMQTPRCPHPFPSGPSALARPAQAAVCETPGCRRTPRPCRKKRWSCSGKDHAKPGSSRCWKVGAIVPGSHRPPRLATKEPALCLHWSWQVSRVRRQRRKTLTRITRRQRTKTSPRSNLSRRYSFPQTRCSPRADRKIPGDTAHAAMHVSAFSVLTQRLASTRPSLRTFRYAKRSAPAGISLVGSVGARAAHRN